MDKHEHEHRAAKRGNTKFSILHTNIQSKESINEIGESERATKTEEKTVKE